MEKFQTKNKMQNNKSIKIHSIINFKISKIASTILPSR